MRDKIIKFTATADESVVPRHTLFWLIKHDVFSLCAAVEVWPIRERNKVIKLLIKIARYKDRWRMFSAEGKRFRIDTNDEDESLYGLGITENITGEAEKWDEKGWG